MKYILFSLLTFFVVITHVRADEAVVTIPTNVTMSAMTKEQKEAYIKKRMEMLGGLVYKKPSGIIAIIDYQGKIDQSRIMKFALPGKEIVDLPFVYQKGDGKFSVHSVSDVMEKAKANAAIVLVEDGSLPMSLCAMEGRWGVVNVAALSSDSPKDDVLWARANKIFSRVATVVLGGSNEDIGFSAMKTVTSLKDLDAVDGDAIAPMGLTQMTAHLARLGIENGRYGSYKQACMQGWAEAPTNDTQKAIWQWCEARKAEILKKKSQVK